MTLQDQLLEPARRTRAVDALASVVDQEVKSKSGLSGAAIKTGYAAVTKASSSVVPSAIDRMLPGFLAALEPFWSTWSASGIGSFGQHLAGRGDEAADALLAVTDRRAQSTSQKVFTKAYNGLRGKAHDNVKAALPRVGDALQASMA